MTNDTNQTRRRFLQATGGAAAALALAGCTGGDGGDGGGGGTTDGGGGATATDAATTAAGTAAGDGGATEGTEDGEDGGTTDGEAQEGGTLEFINSSITTFDPVAATDTASGVVIQQMFDPLMNYPNGQVEVESLIAADYQTSEDFTTYTFTLKEDVPFHNGDTVTASDFVYSFERLAESDNSRRAYFILDSLGVTSETTTPEGGGEAYAPGSLGVEAQDEQTLVVNLDSPFASTLPLLAYSAFAALPEGIVGDIEGAEGQMGYDEFATQNPIGAGPFQFENWSQGEDASVSKFEEYHGDVALLDGIHWATIEDANAQYNYAMNRNADIFSIPISFYDQGKLSVEETDDLGREVGTYGELRNGDTANYLGVPSVNSFYLGFNMANVEKPVRQAFAYMVNQETTANQIFKGTVAPGYHFTPPNIYPGGREAYNQHAEESYPYGYNESLAEEAISVMEEAGFGPNNRASVTYTHYASSDTFAQYGQILRDQLGRAHIDVSIEAAQFSTLIERVRSGNMEVYTLGWIADWPAPDNFLQLLNPPQTDTSESDPISGINWSSETGSAAEQAASAYQTVLDNLAPTDEAEQARNDAYVTIEEANWEDVGFLNLYHRTDRRFWYDSVDVPRFGAMGTSRQKHNHTSKQQ